MFLLMRYLLSRGMSRFDGWGEKLIKVQNYIGGGVLYRASPRAYIEWKR
jgi:hypothetical protein